MTHQEEPVEDRYVFTEIPGRAPEEGSVSPEGTSARPPRRLTPKQQQEAMRAVTSLPPPRSTRK